MDLMDTFKSFGGLKIRFYASQGVPFKTKNVLTLTVLMLS